ERVEAVERARRPVHALGGQALVADGSRHRLDRSAGRPRSGTSRSARQAPGYHRTVRVESGPDVLLHRRTPLLRGQRFALLAHQASVSARHVHAAPLLADLRGATLVRLMAPEHGLWGAAQDHAHIGTATDPVTGLPVVSLYGERREPSSAALRGLD